MLKKRLVRIMSKKETDRSINYWFLFSLLGPTNIASLILFFLGYFFVLGDISWINIFGVESEFNLINQKGNGAARALFLNAYTLLLPINIVWIFFAGKKLKAFPSLRAIALRNLTLGLWNPKKLTLHLGRIKFFLLGCLMVVLFAVLVFSNKEASFCHGCENESVFGFLLIKLIGGQLALMAAYMAFSYCSMWKSIVINFGGLNE